MHACTEHNLYYIYIYRYKTICTLADIHTYTSRYIYIYTLNNIINTLPSACAKQYL